MAPSLGNIAISLGRQEDDLSRRECDKFRKWPILDHSEKQVIIVRRRVEFQ